MSIHDYNNFFLVGIKGVAMTALAQILLDAGKNVSGSDVKEDFVTKKILNNLNLDIQTGFKSKIPEDVDCVVYTAAHKAHLNPQVKAAKKRKIKTYSHAEAQAEFFNTKRGLAVCGVGGKSTVSAMITYILEKTGRDPSYSVGVGNISGLNKTGRWDKDTDVFVVEADEYVTDPSAATRGEEITARFSYLEPYTTVCTNLQFDHPDVYKDFEHTKKVFFDFFKKIHENGYLVFNHRDLKHEPKTSAKEIITFGDNPNADFFYTAQGEKNGPGINVGSIVRNRRKYELVLRVPGKYNLENAAAAIAACSTIGVSTYEAVNALRSFNSTQRRFEFIGTKKGVTYYDDYAHHPEEIKSVIQALNNWYPKSRKVIAFEPHTYSRTKELLDDFVNSFSSAQEVLFIDIFPSAREKKDNSISSDDLVKGIKNKYFSVKTQNLHTNEKLAEYFKENLEPGTVVLTVGAGNIYETHELI